MHTHFYGRVVSAWRVRRNLGGTDEWTLLGKRHPLAEPQSFYPIIKNISAANQNGNIIHRNRTIARQTHIHDDTTLLYGDTIAFR